MYKFNINTIDEVSKQKAIDYILIRYGNILNTDYYHDYILHNLDYSAVEVMEYFWPIVRKVNSIVSKLYGKPVDGLKIHTYLSNKNNYVVNAHKHSKSFVYNNKNNEMTSPDVSWTYYLQVPKTCNVKLKFFDDKMKCIKEYFPVTDDLIIFDSKLYHTPTKNNAEEYRITLNGDILFT